MLATANATLCAAGASFMQGHLVSSDEGDCQDHQLLRDLDGWIDELWQEPNVEDQALGVQSP
ncbi:MAG: hypothetical protein ACRD15_14980 [Vicinamibacterales bacterium]